MSVEAGPTLQVAEAAAAVGLFIHPTRGREEFPPSGKCCRELRSCADSVRYHPQLRDGPGGRLPDGILPATNCVKDVAGYSVKDLFIRGEGTLGVITRVLLG